MPRTVAQRAPVRLSGVDLLVFTHRSGIVNFAVLSQTRKHIKLKDVPPGSSVSS